MPPELDGLAADRVRDLEIPDLLPDLDEVNVLERSENGDDEGADKKTEGYFFLERHDSLLFTETRRR